MRFLQGQFRSLFMEIVCKIVFVYIFKETNIFGKGAQLCHNLGKPSSSERMKLATLFPGTSNATDRKRSLGNPSFDPMLQSINQSQKKKAAMKIMRPVCKEVVLLNRYRIREERRLCQL